MARNLKVEARLIADTGSYTAGIRKALADTDRFGKATQRANKQGTFRNLAAGAAKAAAAVGGLYAVYDQGRKAINTTTDLAKSTIQLTRTTGLSTQEASRFIAITKVRGIETQKLTTSFTILSKQIVAASDGSAKAADAFAKLGVSQDAIRRGDTQQVFLQAADGLSKLENGARKTALAAQLFGRGYQALFPILDLGAKGIQEQLRLAGLLGAEIGDKGVTSYKEYAAAQRTAMLAVMGLRVQLGTVLLQAFTAASTAVAQFVINFRTGEGAAGRLRDRLQSVLNTVNMLFGPITQSRNGVVNLAAAFTTLATAIAATRITATLTGIGSSLTAIFSNPYLAAAAAIAAAVVAIGAAFYLAYKRSADFRKLVDGMARELKPALAEVGAVAKSELPKVSKAAASAVRATTALFRELRPIIVPIVKAVAKIAATEIRGIGPSINIAATAINGLTSSFKTMKSVVTSVVKAAKSVVSGFGSVVSGAMNSAQGAISSLIGTLDSLINKLRNLPGGKIGAKILGAIGSSAGGAPNTRIRTFAANAQDGAAIGSFQFQPEASLVQSQKTLEKLQAEYDKAKKQFDKSGGKRTTAESNYLRKVQGEINKTQSAITGFEKEINRRDALAGLRDQFKGFVEQAGSSFRDRLDQAAQSALDASIARLDETSGDSPEARRLRELRAEGERLAREREDKTYTDNKTQLEADLAKATANGNIRKQQELTDQLLELESQRSDTLRSREETELAASLQRQREAAQSAYNEKVAKNAAETEDFKANLQTQLEAEVAALETRGKNYKDFAASVAAALAAAGIAGAFNPSPGDEGALMTPAAGNVKLPKKPKQPKNNKPKKKASGGRLTAGMFTVGETGPELIMDGNVYSATRTARMSGSGVTLNVYPQTTADDPVALARALGWQLATR